MGRPQEQSTRHILGASRAAKIEGAGTRARVIPHEGHAIPQGVARKRTGASAPARRSGGAEDSWCEAETAQSPEELRGAETERGGGPCLVAVGTAERVADQALLVFGDRQDGRHRFDRRAGEGGDG